MADDVTLEDLQKIYKRFEVLETAVKELARLQKIQGEYDKDMSKINTDSFKSIRDDVKKLDSKVTDMEKKHGKK
jgi:hypothetical protein